MMYFYITYYLRYVEESLDPSTNCMSLHWHWTELVITDLRWVKDARYGPEILLCKSFDSSFDKDPSRLWYWYCCGDSFDDLLLNAS